LSGVLFVGNGETETAEHPNEVRARFYEDKVVLGVVEFGRKFLGYDGTAETTADDDDVLLRG